MPLFVCAHCQVVDNTATGNYWPRQRDKMPPLCTLCDPAIGTWHDRFPRLDWREYLKLYPGTELLDRPKSSPAAVVIDAPEKATRRTVVGIGSLASSFALAMATGHHRLGLVTRPIDEPLGEDPQELEDRARRQAQLAQGPHQGAREKARRRRRLEAANARRLRQV